MLIPKDPQFKKFRPIALTSTLSKLFERLILLRLSHHFEKLNLIPNFQNGFRKGKSCSQCLTTLVSNILYNFSNNKPLCAVFLDIKSAFDNVLPEKLQEILIHFKIPYNVRYFIHKLMTIKSLYFKVQQEILGPYTRNTGVPQGRVLSPLLYNIYTIFLSSAINGSDELLQFADDTIIFNMCLPIKEAILSLQNNINRIIFFFQ